VQYHDEPAMRLSPLQVFFGECEPGHEVTKRLAVLFRDDQAPASPAELIVRHPPGLPLRAVWSATSRTRWTLALTYSPGDAPGAVEGELSVARRSGGESIPVPFTAVVRQR
jgi:hypothetical protein